MENLLINIDFYYITKLERLKTFVYRSDGKGINWAYPLSLENTGFEIIAAIGEQFFAA